MQKLNTKYVQCQTISVLHLCIVKTQVLFKNFSRVFCFVFKGNPYIF